MCIYIILYCHIFIPMTSTMVIHYCITMVILYCIHISIMWHASHNICQLTHVYHTFMLLSNSIFLPFHKVLCQCQYIDIPSWHITHSSISASNLETFALKCLPNLEEMLINYSVTAFCERVKNTSWTHKVNFSTTWRWVLYLTLYVCYI